MPPAHAAVSVEDVNDTGVSRLPNAVHLSPSHLRSLNTYLSRLPAERVIEWALLTFPGVLYQTTSFGPTGSVIIHLVHRALARVNEDLARGAHDGETVPTVGPVPLIFIDTLHHFDETLDLARRASSKYNVPLLVYKPEGCETREEFTAKYGEKLWERQPESYDFLVKSEPSRRSYVQTGAVAVITGRRRSQRGERDAMPVVEIEEGSGLVKLNPLAFWTYDQVWEYIKANDLPYNPLHDRGYKSVGDYHSTQPTKAGEGERAGRWRGQEKTECGLHKDYFAQRRKFLEQKKERERQQQLEAAEKVDAVEVKASA
ncbi:phosophoadenylyl-sulfate reductase [Gonapodya prolifera JEL478]|uniref:Phosophoadenylyl-sulfate reductase n=1 Tax=Gonapodya prolifera (strain JEL478) TaxID=1344416 RepID=A0A138ZXS4_GONPJ|nr:phosophoadenylyl-sulfate reductase [Gonapodya prolifera JEL478]|eukprot:KXS09294.1 phosophoadenylyl-sulfate reductase [Gonapodya prolifera JEL478]